MNTPEFRFHCPHCGQHLLCENDLAGCEIKCPGCQQPLQVPQLCDTESFQAIGEVPPPSGGVDAVPQSEINPRGRALAVLRFRYYFYGALLGALAMSIVSNLIFMVLLGVGARDGGLADRLLEAAGGIVLGAFLTPWGLLGAVVGARWASHRLRVRLRGSPPVLAAADAGQSMTAEAESPILRRGEGPLACGLGLLVPTAYLLPQVMLGLLALLVAPVAVALVLIGVLRARNRNLNGWRQAVGLLLLLLAVGGLLLATTVAMATSVRQADLAQRRQSMHGQWPAEQIEAEMQSLARHPAHAPPPRGGIKGAAFWLAPLCLWLGLACWTGWTQWRCLFWAGVVFALPFGVGEGIRILGPYMVLST